jgi:hypothetical protein
VSGVGLDSRSGPKGPGRTGWTRGSLARDVSRVTRGCPRGVRSISGTRVSSAYGTGRRNSGRWGNQKGLCARAVVLSDAAERHKRPGHIIITDHRATSNMCARRTKATAKTLGAAYLAAVCASGIQQARSGQIAAESALGRSQL